MSRRRGGCRKCRRLLWTVPYSLVKTLLLHNHNLIHIWSNFHHLIFLKIWDKIYLKAIGPYKVKKLRVKKPQIPTWFGGENATFEVTNIVVSLFDMSFNLDFVIHIMFRCAIVLNLLWNWISIFSKRHFHKFLPKVEFSEKFSC